MNDWPPLPANTRVVLDVLVNQLKELDQKVNANERELAQRHKVDPRAKLLFSIPGTSQITATALGATAPGATMFNAVREFGFALPRRSSRITAGSIGSRIAKEGEYYLRHFLVIESA